MICTKWLEEKRVKVRRPIDNFVQLFIGPQVAAIVPATIRKYTLEANFSG